MRPLIHAAVVAIAALLCAPAAAADKDFSNEALADAGVRLEAQIKTDAGTVTKSAAVLRKEADAAFQKNDLRSGMTVLGQLVVAEPNDAAAWLRLARTISDIKPRDNREKAFFLERASTAAYIAYQRSSDRATDAESLGLLGRVMADRQIWRPALDAMRLSLGLREQAELRRRYEIVRADHGFRMLNYTVDSDAVSPRACFQFSEPLPAGGTDLNPFIVVAGFDRPAIAAEDKQLCVDGLKHGERYAVTLRAGLPSTVGETLAKSANYTIFVRDRKPFARFTGKAYVLPRTGQNGIPVQTVNTDAVAIDIYRIGDRNLIATVLGEDFQRSLYPYQIEQIGNERGIKVWNGELAVELKLNSEVTTAFPVTQAVPDLAPGVYVMTAKPKGVVGNDYGQQATQWFIVSDLGLSAYKAGDGIHVFVHSLATAEPRALTELRLVARNNEVLATKRADAQGYVQFDAGLARGEGGLAPAAIVASDRNDYAFLNLRTPAFDLTDRGVAGRAAPGALDAFVYTERGVYRSGETVHVTALLRDAQGVAAAGVPLTLVFERPDGVEYRRTVVQDQGLGGFSLSQPLVRSAMTGTWRVRAYADPKRPALGEAAFMVEDYVPDRLEFSLATAAAAIPRGAPAKINVDGKFLYGAPAAELSLEGEIVVASAAERPGFAGYVFGLSDEDVPPVRQPLGDLPQTDKDGKATFDLELADIPATARPLEARLTVRMAESGGRAVERKLTVPVAAEGVAIGVKPTFSGRSLSDGDNASFDVVVIAADGKREARKGLRWELLRVETRYQWYRQQGSWQYEPVKSTTRVANGAVDVNADLPAKLSMPVTWGRYRLEVSGDDGVRTALSFDAGFYAESSADTPDLLDVALDKKEYRPGDVMSVAVTARSAGRLTLSVFSDKLATTVSQSVSKAGPVNVRLPVGKDWGAGAYIVATLRRPLDAPAKRQPGRAIGVQWFSIDRAAHTLGFEMPLPGTIRPNTTLTIPVKLGGLSGGEEARVVVAAVDVGILNLTNYKAPAPDDYYLGQRRLSAEIRDLYGQLIDGLMGAAGRIRTGGDGAGNELGGAPPTQAPLAFYSGVVKVAANGTAEVKFDIPAFAGTVRVMAVAWSKDKVGKASGDVIVRDPVVLTTTLPRFMRTGDAAALQVELDNVEGAAGDYAINIVTEGTISAETNVARLTLEAKRRGRVALPLKAAGSGAGAVTVRVGGPNNFALERRYAIETRPATQTLSRRTVKAIGKGESLTVSPDMFADFVPGTGRASVSVSISAALDAAALLNALDRYPFGCSEQITSRAVALLYANEVATQANLAIDGAIDDRIRNGIAQLLARQNSIGAFGLWSVGGDDVWLDAYVTDFLTRARERKFDVPDPAFRLALDRLKNFVASAPEPNQDGGRNLAYALYVLARNGAAPVGDLRYYADVKLANFATPIAKAQLAAALALHGDKPRAEAVYAAALAAIPPRPVLQLGREDYGSSLRDSAALVTLAAESSAPRTTIDGALSRIDAARGLSAFTSTQEQAWLVLAARAMAKEAAAISLSVNGAAHKGVYQRGLKAGGFPAPITLTNSGDGNVQAVVTVSGAPLTPEPAAEHGLKIERSFHALDGEAANPAQAKQNQRFAVVLKVTDPNPQFSRLIVADYLPAGFEIDNPRLVSSGDAGRLGWIANTVDPESSEFRDDRFSAAFERRRGGQSVFAVAYVVRAVTPGKYVLPQAMVEDMYRPDRFGRTDTGTVEITAAK
ncbi:MAG: alpha-2-macroglobulin [Pseudolabrys sp.]